MTLELRPYQVASVARARALMRGGVRRLLIAAPTGAGKTVIGADIILRARERGRRIIFVAHRRELIAQTYRKLMAAGIAETEIGVLMGDDARTRPEAPIQIATVATWCRRDPPPADLLIIDEAHRSLSATYLDLVAHYMNSGAVLLGLSATPFRQDGRGLGDVYESLDVVATPRELIAQGYLVAPRVFSAPPESLPQLQGVRVHGGDYAERELSIAMMRGGLVGDIVKHWQRLAYDRRTVVFASGVAHSKAITVAFVKAGVVAEHVDGTTPSAERDAILARLASGATTVVSNAAVLIEGWDCPSVKCAVIARPTRSPALFLQMAGRILRPWQGVGALILDHAGCALVHGLPHADRVLSLDATRSRNGGAAPTRVCTSCRAIAALNADFCPECGAVFTSEANPMPVVDAPGELVEVSERVASPRQIEALRNAGFRLNWGTLSDLQASAMLGDLDARRKRGLCSPKMAAQLRRRGLNPDISQALACVALDAIAEANWRTPSWLKNDPRFVACEERTS